MTNILPTKLFSPCVYMERACSNDSQPNGLSKSLTFPRNRLVSICSPLNQTNPLTLLFFLSDDAYLFCLHPLFFNTFLQSLHCISITAGVVVLSFFSAIKVISSSSLFLPFILSKWRKAKRCVLCFTIHAAFIFLSLSLHNLILCLD